MTFDYLRKTETTEISTDPMNNIKIKTPTYRDYVRVLGVAFSHGFYWINKNKEDDHCIMPKKEFLLHDSILSVIISNGRIYQGYGFDRFSSYTQSNNKEITAKEYFKLGGYKVIQKSKVKTESEITNF